MCISPLVSSLPPTCMPAQIAKSIVVEIEWPTSLTGGERPGDNGFECGGTKKG
jgi:hypothetical protein